jgi:ABC-2 type transport system permease protein
VKRLFAAASVDFMQWRALMRAYVWMDYGSLFGANGSAEAWRATTQLVMLWGVLSMLGLMLAIGVWGSRDPLFAAVIVVGLMMLWTGLIVIMQPGSLVSPSDHEIIGPRPVTSRTYFAVRCASLVVLMMESAVLIGWLPLIAFWTRKGGSLSLAFAAAMAMVAGTLTTTFGILAIYGWLIRIISPARLTRLITYAGAALSLVLTAVFSLGVYALIDDERPLHIMRTQLPHDFRTYWFPPAWFASYVTVAIGTARRWDLAAAMLSLTAMAVFASALGGRMSLEYAARLEQFANATAASRAPLVERAWLFRRGEARAVAILIASHVRTDPRFQMAIATNALMGILIAVGSSGFRMPVDPFVVSGAQRVGGLTMPLAALLMVPLQVYQTIASSTEFEASWLYFSTPADRSRIMTAARDAIAFYVLLPLTLLLGTVYLYGFDHTGHALVHTVFIGVIAYLSLQLTVLIAPRLPFSLPVLQNRQGAFPIGMMMLMVFLVMPISLVVQHFAYRGRWWMVGGLITLGGTSMLLNALTRHRVSRQDGGGRF